MADIKKINATTFAADDLGDVKQKTTIGGKDVDKFVPNLNSSFFGDEFYFNLNRKDKLAVSTVDDVPQITGEDTDDFYIDESGRLKWDILFLSCPKKLTIEWELKHSDGLEFFYQGELTGEEIADGGYRPDEVVGSYAVYCNKANNKYKTGKLIHIYRPFVVDADGEKEWATLLIEKSKLSITLPEDFMSSGKYPVRLDPTIGYSTAGASGYFLNACGCGAVSVSAGAGTLTSFHCAVSEFGSGTSQNVKMAVVPTGGDGEPGGGSIVEQIEFAAVVSDSNENAASGGSINASTEYAVILAGQASPNHPRIKYDSINDGIFNSSPGTYASQFADPLPSGWGSNAAKFSVWVIYTESGGSSPIPAIMQSINQFNGGMM